MTLNSKKETFKATMDASQS